MSIDLTLTYADIGRGSVAKTETAFDRFRAHAGQGVPIITELDEGDRPNEFAMVAQRFPRYRLHTYRNMLIGSPPRLMSYAQKRPVHSGIPKVSPARGILRTDFALPGTNIRFAVLATKAIAGAHNRRRFELAEARRMVLWLRYRAALARELRRCRQQGLTALYAGDMNHVRWSGFPRDRVLFRSGLDRMAWQQAPGGVRIELLDHEAIGLGIETKHELHVCRVRIHPPKTRRNQ